MFVFFSLFLFTEVHWTGFRGQAVEPFIGDITEENGVFSGSTEPKPLVFDIVLTASSCFTSSIIMLIILSTQLLLY